MSPYPPKSSPCQTIPLTPLPEQPLVSIVVPSFNQGQFLRATIDSILSQDYRPLEILVMDGGSRDQSVDVLKSYGEIPELHWVSEKDSGVVEAVNKGFAKARGQVIAIQSSDDTYLPGAISSAVRHFQSDPSYGLVYADTVKIDAEGRELGRSASGPFSLENFLLIRTWIPQPSAFFRRELLETVGGWDDRVPYAADTDLWLRMIFRTQVQKIEEYWSQRRLHEAQRDTQVKKIVRDYTLMLTQSPDIAGAAPHIRNAALASAHLFQVRYNPHGNWHAVWHMFQAGRCDSRVRDYTNIWNGLVHWPLRNTVRWILGKR